MPDINSHLAPCGNGHYTCEYGYQSDQHAKCAVCDDFRCNGADHTACPICGKLVCLGGIEHGSGYGQCGSTDSTDALATCPRCGEAVPPAYPHLGACNLHYICEGNNGDMMHDLCYGCGNGYMCDGNHDWCEFCGEMICNGNEHGDGVCNLTEP